MAVKQNHLKERLADIQKAAERMSIDRTQQSFDQKSSVHVVSQAAQSQVDMSQALKQYQSSLTEFIHYVNVAYRHDRQVASEAAEKGQEQ
ncbi:hypothetical protein [Eupransor demetentiae]|uniref:Uncharacterized protein n=1 Tax=Eupransor demetentiae TaxID=3109584 RepID=A0ABP0EQH2_9LACO|nr:hypothetical protein R54876_GBNLAHCA_01077 [Lactobacillaceae bacterium LMG 33000]